MARFIRNRTQLKGKAPGSYIFLGEQKMVKPRLRIIRYNEEQYEDYVVKTAGELPNQDEDSVSWINIDGMHDTRLLKEIGMRYSIPNLLMEDILNTDHRPGVYLEQGLIRVIMKTLFPDEEGLVFHSEQISFILLPGMVISFQEQTGAFFEPVRERMKTRSGKIRTSGPDYLLYALLDTLADLYLMNNESIGREVEKLEERVLKSTSKEVLDEIYRTRMEIRFLRKHIKPVRDIALQLMRADTDLISERTKTFLTDLDTLLTSAVETLEIYYQMNTDQLNIYQTHVSNRANDVMKVLTIFASIFIPLTFIAGIYGTNFEHMPELTWKNGYYYMLGFMMLVALAMLYYFRKKKWF